MADDPTSKGYLDPMAELHAASTGTKSAKTEVSEADVKSATQMSALMSKMSDLAKAIADQNERSQKATEKILELSKGISENEDKTKDSAGAIHEAVIKHLSGKERINQVEQELLDSTVEIVRHEKEKAELAHKHWETYSKQTEKTKEMKDALEKERDIFKQIGDKMTEIEAKTVNMAGGKFGTAMGTAAQGMFGTATMTEGIKKIGGSIRDILPGTMVGGLIGLMLTGIKNDEDFEAVGNAAAQAFDAVGGATNKFAGEMKSISKVMENNYLGSKEAVIKAASAFAEYGVKSGEALSEIKDFSFAGSKSLVAATLATDKAFELAEGSTAKLSGAFALMSNTTAPRAFEALVHIGLSAKESGANMATFMQQSIDASSSLRLFNANLSQIPGISAGMLGAMGKKGLGFENAFSQQFAASGASNISSTVAGMSEGMSAIIGGRLGYGGGDAFAAMRAMKSPLGRDAKDSLDIGDILKEMMKMMNSDMGLKNDSQKWFALQKVFGFDSAGAETVLKMFDKLGKGDELSKGDKTKLAELSKTEAQKTSDIDKNIHAIKRALADVGLGLLGIIVNVLQGMWLSLKSIGYELKSANPFSSSAERENAAITSKILLERSSSSFDAVKTNIDKTKESIKKVFDGTKNLAGETLSNLMNVDAGIVTPENIAEYKNRPPPAIVDKRPPSVTSVHNTGRRATGPGRYLDHFPIDNAGNEMRVSFEIVQRDPNKSYNKPR